MRLKRNWGTQSSQRTQNSSGEVALLQHAHSLAPGAVGMSGSRMYMYYVEVTPDQKKFQGGGLKEEGEQISEYRVPLSKMDAFLADYEQEKSASIMMGMYWWRHLRGKNYPVGKQTKWHVCQKLSLFSHFTSFITTRMHSQWYSQYRLTILSSNKQCDTFVRKYHSLANERLPPARYPPASEFAPAFAL